MYLNKKYSPAAGFTLIELLVSMTILMLVGSLVLISLTTTLRGADKSQRLITLRQNGNYAMEQMAKTLRQSAKISASNTCDGSSMSSITVTSALDGQDTTYICENATVASRSASGNTAYLLDQSSVETSACSFVCSYTPQNSVPQVTVDFTLIPYESDVTLPETSKLRFTTTTLLRNSEN